MSRKIKSSMALRTVPGANEKYRRCSASTSVAAAALSASASVAPTSCGSLGSSSQDRRLRLRRGGSRDEPVAGTVFRGDVGSFAPQKIRTSREIIPVDDEVGRVSRNWMLANESACDGGGGIDSSVHRQQR